MMTPDHSRLLEHPCRVIALAVEPPEASSLEPPLDELLDLGVTVFLITRSSFVEIDDVLCRKFRADQRNLYVLSSADATVYGFDSVGAPVELHRGPASDDLRWLLREHVRNLNVPMDQLLVAGELDPGGRDAWLRVPEDEGALFAPLAPELLSAQAALHRGVREQSRALAETPSLLPLQRTADRRWLVAEQGLHPTREHEFESLFTVANGRAGVRGSLPEGAGLSAPATLLAGLYDVPPGGTMPTLAILPDWTELHISVDGERLRPRPADTVEHRRELDLRQGVLWSIWRHRGATGRLTTVRMMRLASLAQRRVLLQSIEIIPENYRGHLRLEAPCVPDAVTTHLGEKLDTAAWSHVDGARAQPSEHSQRYEAAVDVGHAMRYDRVITLGEAPVADHVSELARAHARAWADRWRASDVEIDGDAEAQHALRFAIYHLVSSANPEDDRVSIGARGLTGPAYSGHVFWDTEIYMLPFFVWTDPASARAMLSYRHRTLPAARARAAKFGCRGALFAWESASTGEDVTPPYMLGAGGEVLPVLSGLEEHHITADVAYAVWQYWEATGDEAFFRDAGAEILLETAAFWHSRGHLENDGAFHIRKIMGPDEYHDGVDDSAYTNQMARWNLERGAETLRLLRARWPERHRELLARLGLEDGIEKQWLRCAAATYLHCENHVLEQFTGYFGLEELEMGPYGHDIALDLLVGLERLRRSKVIKQADVVLLLALQWQAFDAATRQACFSYYEPRTAHGSSLSPGIHALVAARLGRIEQALRYFRQTAEIDLANNMGNAAGGVHLAALGSLWQATVYGFAGLALGADGLSVDPHLPSWWRRVRVPLQWRGSAAMVTVEPLLVTVEPLGPDRLPMRFQGGPTLLGEPGRRYVGSAVRWQEVKS